MPHFVGVHPGGEGLSIELFAILEEFEPAVLFGLDGVDGMFVQFQKPDAAVLNKSPPGAVAQAKVVDGLGTLG